MSRTEAIAEAIKDYLIGRSVLDIGCGDGEQMRAFCKYADDIRGVDIKYGCDVFKDPIPLANVYYIWINPLKENIEIANMLNDGYIILGANPENNEFHNLSKIENAKSIKEIDVVYDDTHKFKLTVVDKYVSPIIQGV
jgi:hypothetical protein